jgi:hypothetical protein
MRVHNEPLATSVRLTRLASFFEIVVKSPSTGLDLQRSLDSSSIPAIRQRVTISNQICKDFFLLRYEFSLMLSVQDSKRFSSKIFSI